eukprot:TRINITY_DN9833_c0_g1_i2.p1 TRINITY_DN9833_c0_g1~~TRINITY_DN9833_c0_g1_i2.p1  ORF type:complete len:104 (-),score=21.36 TRINITY_DN9833_c0_g1_i2:45-356(-)
MIRRPPRSTQSRSSAASDVYKRQGTRSVMMLQEAILSNLMCAMKLEIRETAALAQYQQTQTAMINVALVAPTLCPQENSQTGETASKDVISNASNLRTTTVLH